MDIRRSEQKGIKLKGNKVYCLKSFAEPDDYDRWFRYCLKEKYNKKYTRYNPDEGDRSLEELVILGKYDRDWETIYLIAF